MERWGCRGGPEKGSDSVSPVIDSYPSAGAKGMPLGERRMGFLLPGELVRNAEVVEENRPT
jgi:hypothetical protein